MKINKKLQAIFVAVFVTLLWASSYIVNKVAIIGGIGTFTLAGLRYLVASAVMFIVYLCSKDRKMKSTPKYHLSWKQNIIMGFTGFFITAGFQYFGQFYLTPTHTSLLINLFNTIAIVFIDLIWIKEITSVQLFIKIFIGLVGALIYYYPWNLDKANLNGIACIIIASMGYAFYTAYTRNIVTKTNVQIKAMMHTPMFIGSVAMLLVGFLKDGFPVLNINIVLIILWLGTINGALAYSLWSWSQKYLRVYESYMINNLMLIEVVLMDAMFFGRGFSFNQIIGIFLVGLAVIFVQSKKKTNK